MKKSYSEKILRVPVRYVDERWEFEYGGIVPVAPGSQAELMIASKSITDPDFLARMTAPSKIKVLNENVTLLAYLAIKDNSHLTENQKNHLISWRSKDYNIATEYLENWNSGGLSLIKVHIGKPTDQHKNKFNTKDGGLWLLTEGRKTVGLQSTQIQIPDGETEASVSVNSLNHAFTRLSEIYEPWRISHTGNAYQRFLYKEKDNRWYPLELLRDCALAAEEQEIAYQLWQSFLKTHAAVPEASR